MARVPTVIAGPRNRGRPVAALEADPRHFTAADIETLTYTLLGEARGEGPIGMLGVANVIRNRADSGIYPSDPVEVVRWDTQPWQFTTNGPAGVGNQDSTRREVAVGSPLYRQAERIVRQAIVADEPTVPDITGRAINYHANYVLPNWAGRATTRWGTVTVGDHIFYARQPVPPLDIPTVASMLDVDYVPPTPMRPMGQSTPGNLVMTTRPIVRNADGTTHTLLSMSFEEDGQEVLVPRVSQDGRVMSPDEAVDEYRRTGQHLGKFSDPIAANRFAEQLHIGQERMFGGMTGPRRDPRNAMAATAKAIAAVREAQRVQAHRRALAEYVAPSGGTGRGRKPAAKTERERAYDAAKRELTRLLTAPKVSFDFDPFAPLPGEAPNLSAPGAGLTREQQDAMRRVPSPSRAQLAAPGAGVSREQQDAMREVRSQAAVRLAAPGANLSAAERAALAALPPEAPRVMREPENPMPAVRLPGLDLEPEPTELITHKRKLYAIDADGNPIIIDAPVTSAPRFMREPANPPASVRLSVIRSNAAAARAAAERAAARKAASDPRQPAGSIVSGKSAARLFQAPGLPIRPDLQPTSGIGVMPDHIAHLLRQQHGTTASVYDYVAPQPPAPAIPSAAIVRQRTKVAPQPAPRPSRANEVGKMPNVSDLIQFRSVPYGGRSSREMLAGSEYEKLGGMLDSLSSPSTAAPKPAPASQRPAPKVTTQTVAPQPRTMTKTIRVKNPEWQPNAIIKPVALDQIVRVDKYGIPTGEVGFGGAPPMPRVRPNVPEYIDQVVTVANPDFLEITVGSGRMPTVAPRPAAVTRRPATAIPKAASNVGVYYAPEGSDTIYSNPTKYGATSDERKASARRRERLENIGSSGGGGSSGVPQSII